MGQGGRTDGRADNLYKKADPPHRNLAKVLFWACSVLRRYAKYAKYDKMHVKKHAVTLFLLNKL